MAARRRALEVVLLALLWPAGCTDEPAADEDDGGGAAGASGGAGGATAAGGAGGAAPACPADSRVGPPEGSVGELTAGGVDFNVRTPPGYSATVAQPLVVVFSPAGVSDPVQTEQFTGLTPDATARGFVIAYVNHRSPQSDAVIADLGTVPGLVAARWCIDTTRIYFTGHSDGGSVASVAALLGTTPPAAAIAPSAAGVNDAYLASQTCPGQLPAMVIHSSGDTLFPTPGFGQGAANFWAGCSQCGAAGTALRDGCVPYDACAAESEVLYCQTVGAHGQWYGLNQSMLDFFERHP